MENESKRTSVELPDVGNSSGVKENICPTYLIEDSPSETDHFASSDDIGPHERIAKALADMILSQDEPGGKMIALEGKWGAGKTTVIGLLKKKLCNKDNITVFSYDAWAHEDDPLRRTFLESLIRHFQNIGRTSWINMEKSNRLLDTLAKRRKVVRNRTIPELKKLGMAFAASVLLVPIGVTFLEYAFQQGITIDPSKPFSWICFFGFLFAFAPFLIITLNFIRITVRNFGINKISTEGSYRSRIGDEDNLDDWAFIGSHSTEETIQETIETPQPTSIEFQDHFCKIMEEALDQHERRVVMVLDNLDRVDAKDALAVWSTLQTFLQCRSDGTEAWFKKLWIIIPYDPDGLRQLWASRGTDDGMNITDNSKDVPESFMDKSFQLRFRVPLPLLSNWKKYLEMLSLQALPHHTPDEAHSIYQVFKLARVKNGFVPTPRELKLYVNQIGTIHRQWQHEFPLDHIAYYTILCRSNIDIRKELLSGKLPDTAIKEILSQNILPNLAGLLFNVTADLGQQLLLDDPITNALATCDIKTLKELEYTHKTGFWVVLEGIMTERSKIKTANEVANTANCLSSAMFDEKENEIAWKAILEALRRTVESIDSWIPFNEKIAKGIIAVFNLVPDRQCTLHILSNLRKTISNPSSKDKVPLIEETITALTNICKEITRMGQSDMLLPFNLLADAEEWTRVSLQILKQDKQWWHFFTTQAGINEISNVLERTITEGKFSSESIGVINVTHSSLPGCDWSSLALALQQYMIANPNAPIPETDLMLQGLSLLEGLGCVEANNSLELLATNGYMIHKLVQADREPGKECFARLLTAFIKQRPDAAKPSKMGDSEAGYTHLINILGTEVPDLAKRIVDILDSENSSKILIKVVEARGKYDPLIVSCLRYIADSDSPERLFTPEVIISHWSELWDQLNSDKNDWFEKLIGQLSSTSNLLEAVQQREGGFNINDARLYYLICKVCSSQAFKEWCKSGLEAMNFTNWKEQLDDLHGGALYLLDCLISSGTHVSLKQAFQDALVSHAESVIAGKTKIDKDFTRRWPKLLDSLGSPSRTVLRQRLLSAAMSREGKCADDFFNLYGDELLEDTNMFYTEKQIVTKLFSPLLRELSPSGLSWLNSIFRKMPDLLSKSNEKDAAVDLVERIQEILKRPTDDGDKIRNLLVEIATNLGIFKEVNDSAMESDVEGLQIDEGK